MQTQATTQRALPFVKWAGGKRSVLPALRAHFPSTFGSYFEPFLGGGAVFFDMQPERAVLRDVNAELITAYCAIRDALPEVLAQLREHDRLHRLDLERVVDGRPSRENFPYFYEVRSREPRSMSSDEVAARFIYLNRTCFNGLYRVNRSGKFNVPAGRYKNPQIVDEANLRACREALAHADIALGDFTTIAPAAGDFVYFDPPYDPVDRPDGEEGAPSFTAYTEGGFGDADQARLRDMAVELVHRGVKVALSNHDTRLIRRLYQADTDCFDVHQIMVARPINSKARERGSVAEVIITSR